MAEGATRGMPLLSGPPPPEIGGEANCRACCKEFNILFARAKRCNHCGYSYCGSSTCSGHHALMPRAGGTGYEVMAVCSHCFEMLMITASGKGHLRLQPLSKLRNYCNAYNIPAGGVIEKDDLVDRIIAARNGNGCLPPENETYYRQHSVPDNPGERARARSNFLNPSAATQPPPRPQTAAPTGPPPLRRDGNSFNPFRPRPPSPPPPPTVPPRPTSAAPRPTAPARPAPPPRPTAPQPTAPPIDRLVLMSDEAIAALSIGQLKAVLADNHINSRNLIEKADLVDKVRLLVHNERADRLRRAEEQEREEREEREQQLAAMRELEERHARGEAPPPDTESATPAKPKMSTAAAEKQGICVVCQNEDSSIAIIDCGHMCMCKSCSELVMGSTRECPLCRTRIISDARLLRIYRS
ncbi:hypothetical protein BKA62DRAFT_708873 [Auriculariales sp. MPI-PUGE-AT-0066]|nr:hypothetical protein BKA62DRAFT_708873 [Auriculariales sp. MPI-PUGE-AT-0066]